MPRATATSVRPAPGHLPSTSFTSRRSLRPVSVVPRTATLLDPPPPTRGRLSSTITSREPTAAAGSPSRATASSDSTTGASSRETEELVSLIDDLRRNTMFSGSPVCFSAVSSPFFSASTAQKTAVGSAMPSAVITVATRRTARFRRLYLSGIPNMGRAKGRGGLRGPPDRGRDRLARDLPARDERRDASDEGAEAERGERDPRLEAIAGEEEGEEGLLEAGVEHRSGRPRQPGADARADGRDEHGLHDEHREHEGGREPDRLQHRDLVRALARGERGGVRGHHQHGERDRRGDGAQQELDVPEHLHEPRLEGALRLGERLEVAVRELGVDLVDQHRDPLHARGAHRDDADEARPSEELVDVLLVEVEGRVVGA